MKRYFNTEGQCISELHYMVRLDERLDKIRRQYIDPGKYFIINRGRQYGKTTTLCGLEEYLKNDYVVVSMDFQGIGTAEYQSEFIFTKAFMRMFIETLEESGAMTDEMRSVIKGEPEEGTLSEMFRILSEICKTAPKPVVLMIDEVDSASNNQVFIDFLAQLRYYYLKRQKKPTFHSVILAGVYDVKNLKLKIRPKEEHQYNSPWNIAASFDIDMSFSTAQIAGMLEEYESDNHTGMKKEEVAEAIYQYTSGYPYLVSAICKIMDEEFSLKKEQAVSSMWTKEGVANAIKRISKENIPLFESMMRHVNEYSNMKQMLYAILFQGESVAYNPDNQIISLANMLGYIRNHNGNVQIANRIFETRLYDYFLSEEELTSSG